MSKQILILGGGPAGVAVAYYLGQQNIPYKLIEAKDHLGGNASTYWEDGLGYDSGAHRLHDIFPEITDEFKKILGNQIQEISTPSQIYSGNTFFDFPLSPFNIIKGLSIKQITKASIDFIRRPSKTEDFQDLALSKYGNYIANRFLLPYTQKLWQTPCHQLSTQVAGKRLKNLDIYTFLNEIFQKKEIKTKHLDGKFYYPLKGIGQLFDILSKNITVAYNSKVDEITLNKNYITKVQINGIQHHADIIINTLPLSILANMLGLKQTIQQLSFIDLYLVKVFLNKTSITNNASIYFPDNQFVFTRIVEPRNRSTDLAPQGKTMLVAEVPIRTGEIYNEEELQEKVLSQLLSTGLINKKDVNKISTRKLDYAYPILTKEYEKDLFKIKKELSSINNLFLTGRVATFSYQHIHDHFREGKIIAEKIANER